MKLEKNGIDALTEKLGTVGMIHFMQQDETGYGDYTKERAELLGNPTIEELAKSIKNLNKP